ncbi:MAG TPA: hypothetical protein VKU19_34655 [Bryobacteraceae bacterium]|nr:hypothetical protein [Bryobacteraceae bacterium]
MRKYLGIPAALTLLYLAGSLFQSPQSQLKGVFSSPVTVVNANNAPAFVTGDHAGRIPYQATAFCFTNGTAAVGCTAMFAPVPAGFRLVVEDVAVEGDYGGQPPSLPPVISVNGIHLLGATVQGSNGMQVMAHSLITSYVDGGQTPEASLGGPSGQQAFAVTAKFTGYELNCSIVSCPPIISQ